MWRKRKHEIKYTSRTEGAIGEGKGRSKRRADNETARRLKENLLAYPNIRELTKDKREW